MRSELKVDQTVSTQAYREMLTRLQKEAFRRIRDLRSDQRQESQSESEPADEMDSASRTAEVETHAGLIAREEDKLKYLDEALARLDAGKYGICLGCRESIPLERLKVLPFASYCVECQEKRNRARHNWGEGTMIQPYDQQWTVPEEMEEPGEREYRSTAPEEDLSVEYRAPRTKESRTRRRRGAPLGTQVQRRKK